MSGKYRGITRVLAILIISTLIVQDIDGKSGVNLVVDDKKCLETRLRGVSDHLLSSRSHSNCTTFYVLKVILSQKIGYQGGEAVVFSRLYC